jgi:hypothetical protein
MKIERNVNIPESTFRIVNQHYIVDPSKSRLFTHIYIGNSNDVVNQFFYDSPVIQIYRHGNGFNLTVFMLNWPEERIKQELIEQFDIEAKEKRVIVGIPRYRTQEKVSEITGFPMDYVRALDEIDVRTRCGRLEMSEHNAMRLGTRLNNLGLLFEKKYNEWKRKS